MHANTPRDAVKRLEQMVSMAGMALSPLAIRSQIASAVCLLMQLQRLPDGRRRLVSLSEITGMEGDVYQMHDHCNHETLRGFGKHSPKGVPTHCPARAAHEGADLRD